jgi:hypothetical protein
LHNQKGDTVLQCVSRALVARRPAAKADISRFVSHALGEHSALWLRLALIHAVLDTVALAPGQQQCENQHC